MKRSTEILNEMHRIINPGEYGLGSEPISVPDSDKKAWERCGELLDELLQLLEGELMPKASTTSNLTGWSAPNYAVTPQYLSCLSCDTLKRVLGTRLVETRRDPTETYLLSCGHIAL